MQTNHAEPRTPVDESQTSSPVNISKILLIGCGGVGSFIAQYLGLVIGVDTLMVVDGDTFERKNTNRQALAFAGINERKVDALARSMPFAKPDIETLDEFITEDNWAKILNDFDPTLIISAVDNDKARKLIFAEKERFPILWGANELWTPQAGISLPQKPWSPLEAFQAAEEAGTACGVQTVHANACAAAMAMQLLMMHSTDHEQWDKLPMFMSKQSGERLFYMTASEI